MNLVIASSHVMLRNFLLLLVALVLVRQVEGAPPTSVLNVHNGNGDGEYETGTIVTVSADPPPAGEQFTEWLGDTAILSNPFLPTTTAIVPSMDVTITAAYNPAGLPDRIRFYPRPGYTSRMVGGVFEGTDGDPVAGPYRTLYTITTDPPEGWSEVKVNLSGGSFIWRYLRYRGPNGSHGNVAEIEFYHGDVRLTEIGIGLARPVPGRTAGTRFTRRSTGM